MQKNLLEKLIDQGLTQRQIAVREGVSQTTVRYWLRIYNMQTRHNPHARKDNIHRVYRCQCGETNPDQFYGRTTGRCKRCHNANERIRERQNRQRIIEYLGGCCAVCGFSKYRAALDVHHCDPSLKDVAFAAIRKWRWDRVRQELCHCVLLCKNCHSAFHAGQLTESGVSVCILPSGGSGAGFDSQDSD